LPTIGDPWVSREFMFSGACRRQEKIKYNLTGCQFFFVFSLHGGREKEKKVTFDPNPHSNLCNCLSEGAKRERNLTDCQKTITRKERAYRWWWREMVWRYGDGKKPRGAAIRVEKKKKRKREKRSGSMILILEGDCAWFWLRDNWKESGRPLTSWSRQKRSFSPKKQKEGEKREKENNPGFLKSFHFHLISKEKAIRD
jgi:hypothetical protein